MNGIFWFVLLFVLHGGIKADKNIDHRECCCKQKCIVEVRRIFKIGEGIKIEFGKRAIHIVDGNQIYFCNFIAGIFQFQCAKNISFFDRSLYTFLQCPLIFDNGRIDILAPQQNAVFFGSHQNKCIVLGVFNGNLPLFLFTIQ